MPKPVMNRDISDILDQWPYDRTRPNIRLIQGQDGQPLLQVRLDLGLLQMHVDGRPDGQMPHGYRSLLEYYESLADDAQAMAEEGESHEEFELSPEDCKLLREEAAQYYHRYVALLVLNDFDGVIRDTARNLRLIEFLSTHAREESDRRSMVHYRPFILTVRTRALAGQMLRANESRAAVALIDEGLEMLQDAFAQAGEPEAFESSAERRTLVGMREAIQPKLMPSQAAELEARLARALEAENYELAAILRDELKALRDRSSKA
ncbi:MAG: UvrB/UvrC protein [Phycisphaerales bacterium]|nr:MAG: UvrB/UvrC protein [Phycisphaerales bacterium]